MSAAETAVRRLAAALYPGYEVWTGVSPQLRRVPECHYVLCGRTRWAHRTLGCGPSPEVAWAEAEALLRREVDRAIADARRDRDRADADIARLTAALEVQP